MNIFFRKPFFRHLDKLPKKHFAHLHTICVFFKIPKKHYKTGEKQAKKILDQVLTQPWTRFWLKKPQILDQVLTLQHIYIYRWLWVDASTFGWCITHSARPTLENQFLPRVFAKNAKMLVNLFWQAFLFHCFFFFFIFVLFPPCSSSLPAFLDILKPNLCSNGASSGYYMYICCRVKMAKFRPCFFWKSSSTKQILMLECWPSRGPKNGQKHGQHFNSTLASILAVIFGPKLSSFLVAKNSETHIFIVLYEEYRTHPQKRSRQKTCKNCSSRVWKTSKVEAQSPTTSSCEGKARTRRETTEKN